MISIHLQFRFGENGKFIGSLMSVYVLIESDNNPVAKKRIHSYSSDVFFFAFHLINFHIIKKIDKIENRKTITERI